MQSVDRPRPKQPRDIIVQPRQRAFGIPTGQPQVQDIPDAVPNSLPPLLAMMLEQGRPLSEAQRLQQALFMQVGQQPLHVEQRHVQGGVDPQQFVADLLEVARPVQQAQHAILFRVQAMVFQPDRILDDPGADPLVFDPPGDEIGPAAHGDRTPRRGDQRRRGGQAHGCERAAGRGDGDADFIEVFSSAGVRRGRQDRHRGPQAGPKHVVGIGDLRPDACLTGWHALATTSTNPMRPWKTCFSTSGSASRNAEMDRDGRADLHVPNILLVHVAFDPDDVGVDDLQDRVSLVDGLPAVLLDARHDAVEGGQNAIRLQFRFGLLRLQVS